MNYLSPQKATDQNERSFQQKQGQGGDVDLRELFYSLWEGKLVVILISLTFFLVSIAYSLLGEEKWEAKAKIAPPEKSDFNLIQNQVSQLQPIFGEYTSNGFFVRDAELDAFLSENTLLNVFVQQFNSRKNKKEFLDSSLAFNKDAESLSDEKKKGESKINVQELYHAWYKKIIIKKVVRTKSDFPQNEYQLIAKGSSAEKSYELLREYLNFIDMKSRDIIQKNLQSLVDNKKNEIIRQLAYLKEQAKVRLSTEKLRTKYEIEIAKSAKIIKPLENHGGNSKDIFSINLGVDALKAKAKLLDGIESLSLFESMIDKNESKLTLLQEAEFTESVAFDVMQYIEPPETPHKLTAPNRFVISMIGGVLGAVLGVVVVLVSVAFRKRENLETNFK